MLIQKMLIIYYFYLLFLSPSSSGTTGEKKSGDNIKETCRDMTGLFKGLKCCQEEEG